MNKHLLTTAIAVASLGLSTTAMAEDHSNHAHHMDHSNHQSHAGSHHVHQANAPISIMGAHSHDKGDFMVSYRYSRMDMGGNRVGTNDVSPEEIVTNFATNNFSPTGTNRVVPTEMTMDMHMLGAMYGLTDRITLMAMGMYIRKEMDHITFQGLAGTTRLGEFTTRTSGIGDTTVGGIYELYQDGKHEVLLNAGLSLPTGSIDEEDEVLAPNNTRPTLRLPYAMQLGTGTFDFLPGVTYNGHKNAWSWGGQYSAAIRLEDENSEGYSWGDRHEINAWGGYQFTPLIQGNVRASFETMGDINGRDSEIAAPVQTADPNNYGGEIAELAAGFNLTPHSSNFEGHQLGFEVSVPVYQDLSGPQMERDYTITGGWTFSF